MTQTFPVRLAYLVSLAGLPMVQAESLAGLARSHMQKLVSDERKPTAGTARKIAGVFVASRDVNEIEDCAAWLLFGAGSAPTKESASAGVEAAKARVAKKATKGTTS